VKNNQQKEDSRRKMQEYNSNIVIINIRIKDDRSPFKVELYFFIFPFSVHKII